MTHPDFPNIPEPPIPPDDLLAECARLERLLAQTQRDRDAAVAARNVALAKISKAKDALR